VLTEELSVETGQNNSSVAKPQTAQWVAKSEQMIEGQKQKTCLVNWLIIRANKRNHLIFQASRKFWPLSPFNFEQTR
jgi:hypothetical protein